MERRAEIERPIAGGALRELQVDPPAWLDEAIGTAPTSNKSSARSCPHTCPVALLTTRAARVHGPLGLFGGGEPSRRAITSPPRRVGYGAVVDRVNVSVLA